MEKPKVCGCGGAYKRAPSPENKREGSRYFACNRCGARIEQTSNGYEFKDPAPPPPPTPAPAPVPPLPRRPW
jgi:hypothetical protein